MSTPAPTYTEHTNAEGRTYWYNTVDKTSVWEKPDALKTPFERALAETSWKEYLSNGRKYWVHKETKQSVWNMPDELLTLLEKVAAQQPPPAPPTPQFPPPAKASLPPIPTAAALPSSGSAASPSSHYNPASLPPVPNLPSRPSADQYVIPEGGWASVAEAEEAFTYLLKKSNIDVDSTWDQVMRAIITDPLYKSLNSLAAKKAVFTKYVADAKAKQLEEKEARLQRIRPQLRKLLADHPSIRPYSTFKTADKLFADAPVWLLAMDEEERRNLFDEYIQEVKAKEAADNREIRTRNITKLTSLVKNLGFKVSTRWRDAQADIMASDEWKGDSELRLIDTLEILIIFEDHVRELEKEHDAAMRKAKMERARSARKARDEFKDLLQELVQSNKVTARSRWKDSIAIFGQDHRYLNLLGKPGSTPLDLWMDVVDELDLQLEDAARHVQELLSRAKVTVTPETTYDEVTAVVDSHDDLSSMDDGKLRSIFDFLHAKVVAKHAEEVKRAERKKRHQIEDFRYALKKLDPPIDLETSYEDSVSSFEHLREYTEMADEDRRLAFSKFIKRQKEKLREAEEDDRHRDSRRPRSSRDTDVLMDYGGGSSSERKREDGRKDRGSSSGTKRSVEEKDGHDRLDRKGSQPGEEERQAKRPRPSAVEDTEMEEGEI